MKDVVDFYKNRHKKSGMQSRCKACTKLEAILWRNTNLIHSREIRLRRYYKKTYGEDWKEMRELVKLDKEIRGSMKLYGSGE